MWNDYARVMYQQVNNRSMKALVKHMTHLSFCDYSICLNGFKLMRDITVFAIRVEFGKSLHFAMRRGLKMAPNFPPI